MVIILEYYNYFSSMGQIYIYDHLINQLINQSTIFGLSPLWDLLYLANVVALFLQKI